MLKNLRTFVHTAALILIFAAGGASAQQSEAAASRPDIKAESVRVPDGFKAGVGNRVLVRVRNLSREVEVETPFTVRLEVIREDGERTVFDSTVDRLGREQARELSFTGVSVPHGRTVRFLLVADPERSVDESNYGNNRYLFQVTVEGGSTPPAVDSAPEAPSAGEEPESQTPTTEEPRSDVPPSEEPPITEEPTEPTAEIEEEADSEGAEPLEESDEPAEPAEEAEASGEQFDGTEPSL